MTISHDKLAELRVKQLEMIQAIVSRVASNEAALKNWCITVTTTVCGFGITLHQPLVTLLALLPITSFALLDAQYLRVERRFRRLFDHVRREDWAQLPGFEISLSAAPKIAYWDVLCSWSIFNFYAPLALGVVIVVVITGYVHGL
jgi:hypothetical protein